MKDFRTRKSSQAPFHHSWFFLILLVLVLALFARSAYASFVIKRSADLEKDKYEQRLNSLENQKQNLENKIEQLKTDRGKEEELRKRFNVTREGEKIIRIIESTD
jgi:cell division protein FtsB